MQSAPTLLETQGQLAAIGIASLGGSYEDITNSAEIEQKAEQENKDCEVAICANTIGAQAQVDYNRNCERW